LPLAGVLEAGLYEIGRLELPPGAVADGEHFDFLQFLKDAVYHAINIRLVAAEQVPQLVFLTR
jgi:hypothetical protein